MTKAKKEEAFLSVFAIVLLVAIALVLQQPEAWKPMGRQLPLCDFVQNGAPCQEGFAGGGYGGGGGRPFIAPPANLYYCGEFCWLVIGWLVERGTNMAEREVQRNSCSGACGGGGGGGFECAPDDRSCNTMNTW